MSNISAWSTTAASNNSAPPDGWPEGQAPSSVNNCARENMAAVRRWYEDAQWINLGYTHTYASATSFTIASTDVTSIYTVGRRIRAVGSGTGTIYGTITASSFSTNTTITVGWDSGSLSNEDLTVSIGALTPGSDTIPFLYKKGVDVSSATSTDIWKTTGELIHITGTTTITSFGTAPRAGMMRALIFDGALTLTHGASAIVIPGAANITTAANDVALVYADTTTKHYVVSYFRAVGGASGALLAANNLTDVANTATAFGNIKQAATTSATGVVELATDAETTTGTDTGRVAPVSSMIYHEGVVKAWVSFNASSGTPTIGDSFNVTSLTDGGVGTTTVNFTTSFASANYALAGSAGDGTSGNDGMLVTLGESVSKSTGSCQIYTVLGSTSGKQDCQYATAIFIGDR